ncbi:MAG: hypothetical protein J6Y19_01210 [Kiritimatiellae bacterium]|nr:hypothetical protein [Kiritimatiellia bacterium]
MPPSASFRRLFHLLFDTLWGPAATWLVASVLSWLAFDIAFNTQNHPQSTGLLVLVCLPLFLAALVLLSALVLSLLRRRFLHALLQLLLVVVVQAATGMATVPLISLFVSVSSPHRTISAPAAP